MKIKKNKTTATINSMHHMQTEEELRLVVTKEIWVVVIVAFKEELIVNVQRVVFVIGSERGKQ